MHACLNVDEILRLIACELVASKARATTVALACCCKSFEDPVLDVPWETQDRLTPLLDSLPRGVWNKRRRTVSAPITCFLFPHLFVQKPLKRLPTTLEWARFRKYARRMRNLEEGDDPGALSSEVFSVLQVGTANEPLLPNLRTLCLRSTAGGSIPFIPFILSPRTTVIDIEFSGFDFPTPAVVASMLTTLPTLCPNLEKIVLQSFPSDLAIAADVSGMLLTTNRNTLRCLQVDSPLTEEAREAICKLSNLRELSVEISENTSLPLATLPNLTSLEIIYYRDRDLFRMFHGATLQKLESVTFRPQSEKNGDFLGEFESVALAALTQNTLSKFTLYTPWSWNPSYTSLLPFTQMTCLEIQFSCGDDCSSSVDDNIVTNLARAMPKLETLQLGNGPCYPIHTGVTVEGLVALAHHCQNLAFLCVHFQVDSLIVPPTTAMITSNAGSTPLRRDCALRYLVVGIIPVPEESVLVVALTLARIFPRIERIESVENDDWEKVMDTISLSRKIIDFSGKQSTPLPLRYTYNLDGTSPGATLKSDS